MKLKDAIEIVLKAANGPLHIGEITRLVIKCGLWSTNGATPEATVSARLSTSVKKGENRFVWAGPGEYAIYGWHGSAKTAKPNTVEPKIAGHSLGKGSRSIGDSGYVYILTNPSFRKDWVKIGMTERPVNIRSKELDNTAVPLPFEIYATLKTAHRRKVENLLHGMIDDFDPNRRIRKSREFFNINPETALRLLIRAAEAFDEEDNISRDFNKTTPAQKAKSKISPRAMTSSRRQKANDREATWSGKTQFAKLIARRGGNVGSFGVILRYLAPKNSNSRLPCHPNGRWRKLLEDAGVKFDRADFVTDWTCAKNPL